MRFINRFLRDHQGQDLIEYTLMLAFVALASAGLYVAAGGSVSNIWGQAADASYIASSCANGGADCALVQQSMACQNSGGYMIGSIGSGGNVSYSCNH